MAGCPSSAASSSSCLDAEAMPHVSAFLSCEDRGNAARVCRAWRDAMRREASWKKMDLRSYRNKDTDCIVEAIAGKSWLRGVEHLNLEFLHNLLDRHLVRLSEVLHALKNININGCQRVTDRGVEAIARSSARSLVSIELYWNLLLTDAAVKALSGHCPQLRSVNLSGCKHITDASLFALAEGCWSVTDLNLTRCPKITDDGLKRIAQRCNRIVDLNLYAVSTFTDKSLASFGCLAHLRALDLCGAHLITDEGLACLAVCHDLRLLNLTWCVRITDEGMHRVAMGCKMLELLSLHGVLGVTDKTVEALAGNCENLHTLDVNGCGRIAMKRDLASLRKRFPRLVCTQVHK